ncbi:MAG: hypothetical protein M3400_12885 [Actinomycetota bacterium]|nr:hypothetical protein [Actinomycetota bacterium]
MTTSLKAENNSVPSTEPTGTQEPTTNSAPTTSHRPSTSAPRPPTTQPPQPPPPPPPPPPLIETEPVIEVTDECATADDGVTLFPYEGGFYTDVNGTEIPATGVLIPVVGTIVINAVTQPGYVFTDGSTTKQFDLTFTDVPC